MSMGITQQATWADPLSRTERAELARKLARACKASYGARRNFRGRRNLLRRNALTLVSYECSELHLDVTERADVATS